MKAILSIVLLLAVCSVMGQEELKYENDVLILTDKNFQQATEKFPFMLIKFYAPWCGHCKSLAPHFEKAAVKLVKAEPQVILAHMDCTVEKDTCGKLQVQGYPTLKFFTNGNPIEYQGGRTEDTIVSWCLKKTGPASIELSDKDSADKFIADNKVAVIYFGDKSANFETFEKFAKTFDDVVFGHTFDESIKKEFNVEGATNVVLFKQFDEKRNDCNCEINAETLKTFVDAHSLPMIMDFDQKSAQIIFGEQKPCLFLLVDKTEKSLASTKILVDVASKLQGKILVSQSEIEDGLGKRLGDFIGAKSESLPTFMIVQPGAAMKKFTLTEEHTVENLLKFYEQFTLGKLTAIFKSDPIPETNDKPVKTIVGKSFQDIVFDETKDVLVKFYAPWCGHCKTFAPLYEKAAESILAANPNIILADFDATTNEAEGVEIQGFPTIKFYPANNKKAPIDFSEERTEAGVYKFLKEKNTVGFVQTGDVATEEIKDDGVATGEPKKEDL